MPHSNPRPRRDGGFTLVEIMVVIVIIGMLAALVAPSVLGHQAEAEKSTAAADVSTIHQAAQMYFMRVKRTPTVEDLITPDENNQAYLDGYETDPLDPWHNPYVIRELEGYGKFEVLSFGPDGSEGTEDDISSARKQPQR